MANLTRERACEGKKQYRTRGAARAAVTRKRRLEGAYAPYRCPWCPFWHVGHPLGREPR